VAFAVVAVAHWKFGLNPILAFWICYVLTRPVGASYADWVAFPTSVGGLGVGHGPVALFLTFLIVIFVGYLAVTRRDVEEVAEAAPRPTPTGHRRGARPAAEYPPTPPGARRENSSPGTIGSPWGPADRRPAVGGLA